MAAAPGRVTLSWVDGSSDESGFRLERRLEGTADFAAVASTGPDATTCLDTGVAPSQRYEYRLIAVGPGGASSPAGPVLAVTPAAAAPTSVQALARAAFYDFERDYRQVTQALPWRYRTAHLGTGSWADLTWGMPFGSPGWEAPSSSSNGLLSAQAGTLSLHPGPESDLNRPTAQFVVPATGEYAISIQVRDADAGTAGAAQNNGVDVRISRGDGPDAAPAATVLAAAVVDLRGAEPTLGYARRLTLQAGSAVSAIVGHNGHPFWDDTRCHWTMARLDPGGAVALEVELSWQGVDPALAPTGYEVRRRPSGSGAFATLATVPSGSTAYLDPSPAPGASYDYAVLAVYSPTVAASAAPVAVETPPAAPSALVAAPLTSTSARLTWVDAATTETGYRLERRTPGSRFTEVAALPAGTTTVDDTALTTGETYEYRVVAIGAGGVSSAPSGLALLAPDLRLHWGLDEGSGAAAADLSGSGNGGTLVGSPARVGAAPIGSGLAFPAGGADYVRASSSASLEPTAAITIALWARPEDEASGAFADLVRKADAGQPGYLLRWSHADGRVQLRLDRQANPSIALSDDQANTAYLNGWHHFAASYDAAAGVARLFVDGTERAALTGLSGVLEHSGDLTLMGQPTTGHETVVGRADDVRIYGRALSRAEIQRLAGW